MGRNTGETLWTYDENSNPIPYEPHQCAVKVEVKKETCDSIKDGKNCQLPKGHKTGHCNGYFYW